MVTSIAVPDWYGRLAETAFITPTETLREVYPALQLSDLCPYRSLEAFTEADVEFFFGRERVVARLVESLRREPRFLAVLGPSGSGKSSLVQAGLIPYLRRGAVPSSDRWGVIVARPADQPFHQLEVQGLTEAQAGLDRAVQTWLKSHPDRERLVLVLDQFEELMVTAPEEVRLAFLAQLAALLEAFLPITIVLVLRDDFYSRFVREATVLLPWLERGLVNVPPMLTGAELQDIIEEPARAMGLTFEAGLVTDILQDALESVSAGEERVGRSTVLPLLEFALTQLWERRQDGVLTQEAYETIGRVTGGLTQWADRAYYGLGKEQQRLARRVLTDLVHLGDESQGLPDSRRRRPLEILYRVERNQEAIHGVVRRLTNARLLVTGRDLERGQETAELIHDALLREWGLLQGWLAEDRRFLAWRQTLEEWLGAWVESAPDAPARRDSGWLLRSRDLVEAERWLIKRRNDLRVEEQAFIQTGLTRTKRVRFLRGSAVVFAFLVVSLLALFAWSQRNQAVHEAGVRATAQAEAEEQRHIALARQLAAQSQSILNNTRFGLLRSMLLSIESLRRFPSLEGDQAIRYALSFQPRLVTQIARGISLYSGDVAFNSNGHWVATRSKNDITQIWEVATRQEVGRVTHETSVKSIALSPNGKWLATGNMDGTVRIWEVATGRNVAQMLQVYEEVPGSSTIIFSPDSKWVLTKRGRIVWVWELATGRSVARLVHNSNVYAMTLSPNGELLATGSENSTITLWEIRTERKSTWVAEDKYETSVSNMSFSSDSRLLATVGRLTVQVWNVATKEELTRISHSYQVMDIAFSPDNSVLATGSGTTAWLWNVVTGEEISRLTQDLAVCAIAFSSDGHRLAAAGCDPLGEQTISPGTARVWEVATGKEVARILHHSFVWDVTFSSDTRWLMTRSEDGIQIWDVDARQEAGQVEHSGGWVLAIAFDSQGRWFATAGSDGTAQIWEVITGRKITRIKNGASLWAVTFSPDDQWLATGSDDGTARVWDVSSGQEVARMIHELPVWAVDFSPDGKLLATGSGTSYKNKVDSGETRIWNIATGQEIASPVKHNSKVNALAFSPDGTWLAAVEGDIVQVWAVSTGEKIASFKHESVVWSLAFRPDGHWLATGSDDGIARIWEINTEREISRMEHNLPVWAVTFSPDGKWLATASDMLTEDKVTDLAWWEKAPGLEVIQPEGGDVWWEVAFIPNRYQLTARTSSGTVRVWEIATGKEMARVIHQLPVWDVTFSPNGHWLATGSADRTGRIWLWQPEDLIADACARLTRNLTQSEWGQFLPGEPYRPTCPNLPVPEE